ncbi:site-2 protease family protein [Aestuariivita sp.]|jgi:Zn-dependent protease/predicted transcriptional regulator|uniref:site-2 protease family protein n=1 Tax=Aestuariivita sp. TaxID=1872407 RepID=UPI0021717A98|nr:site-2 protease family protein [Aestuariivita sp.]MCE8005950.1 CBS domain-containing protein [Aestuariivita sp.]
MFSHALKLFTLRGFDIRVDPSWVLIAALITWSLSQQYFPMTVPGLTQSQYLSMAVIAMLAFFASLLLHELAHATVARRYGVNTSSITLFLFGGVAELEDEPSSAAAEFWIAIAGPAASCGLAFGFWVLAGTPWLDPPARQVLSYLATINLIIAVFNMMPAYPLDGGRVLRAWIWNRSGDLLKATETAARSGTIFAYILMGLGVVSLFQGAQVAGIWQLLIGGFLLIAARSALQHQMTKTVFAHKTVAQLMTAHPIVTSPDLSLADLANQIMLRHRISFVPVVEDGVLLGQVDSAVLGSIDRENWINTRVGDVYVALSAEISVSPDLSASALLARMTQTGRRKFLVADHRTLVGVISLSDLLEYIALHQTLGLDQRRK